MPKIEMNLADYLRVVRKRKRIIILAFLLVFFSTVYFTLRQTPIYKSSCRVKIEQRKSVAEILTELVTWSPGDEMASQANLIKSYQVMEKVAEELNLLATDMKLSIRMAAVKGIQNRIETEQVGFTNIINITATSNNPEKAMNLANAVAQVYAESHFENKKKEASNVKEFVKDQLDNYLLELQRSERALQKFRQENPLVAERDIKSASVVQMDPRVASLKEEIVKLELELISKKSQYTDEHPEVITIKRQIKEAKRDLSEALSQLTIQQSELSTKEIELIQLKRNVSIAEEVYLMFKTKYEEARILEAEKVQDVTIVEPAALPSSPVSPNKSFNFMIGILSGLLFGLIMAFITESFDTSIGRVDDIEELTKVPVLGIIPNTSMEKEKSIIEKVKKFIPVFKKRRPISESEQLHERLVTLFEPTSVAAEAYKTLRTHLDLTGLKKVGNSIIITSASPQEGKTQTLANLGIAIAQSGQKVLIVGSDFRKPMIYKLFGLKRSPGLSEVLIGKISWKDAVCTEVDMLIGGLEYEKILKTQGIENLRIIPCGERTPNPAELLSFPEMDDVIEALAQEFDVVLFDSPPVLPVTDSAILAAKTDGVIMVYQVGRTSRHALNRARIQLENVDAKILGVVINNLKAEFIEDVTPYQRYRYYGYYGEKRERKE
jgi:succinoglycan biosynthesis transport protein ExoP